MTVREPTSRFGRLQSGFWGDSISYSGCPERRLEETVTTLIEDFRMDCVVVDPLESALQKSLDESGIVVPDSSGVAGFLATYRGMEDLVKAVCDAARREFDKGEELSLEVIIDPEDGQRSLVLFVRQREYEETIMDRVKTVSSPSLVERSKSSGFFWMTTDFGTPRAVSGDHI